MRWSSTYTKKEALHDLAGILERRGIPPEVAAEMARKHLPGNIQTVCGTKQFDPVAAYHYIPESVIEAAVAK